MGEDELHRIVVLSDSHFGEDGAMLTREDVVEGLLSELRRLGRIDLLVLLGDIWDLWRNGFTAVAEAGAPFFRALAAWNGPREFLLVPGNHDYHLWEYHEEGRRRRAMGWEEVEGVCVLTGERADENILCLLEELPLWLHYPFLSLRVGGRDILLMHGHHLDFFSRSFWWAKTYWLARWILKRSSGVTLSDLDRLNKPFFELLTQTAYVPELRAWEYRFYAILRFLARLLRFDSKSGGSPRRYTSVEQNTKEATGLLREFLPGFIPDVYVFGHTHQAGFSRIRVGPRPVLLANCGCWLEDDVEATGGTYVVIDDKVRLRRLGEGEVSVRA